MKKAFELAGKPQLLIVDGGGTLFDPGSVVPVYAFQGSFQNAVAEDGKPYGIEVPFQTIIRYMGMNKLEHIRKLLEEPEIKDQFNRRFGRMPVEDDGLSIYEGFKKGLYPSASKNEEIPGVKEACFRLKEEGIPMVMTTGYDRRMVDEIRKTLTWLDDILLSSVTVSDINENKGRPAPFMIYHALERALVENPGYAVNVGDTEVDTLSADNAYVPGIIVTSESLKTKEEADMINRKIGRKHLIADSLVGVIDYILDGTLADRIRALNN